MNHAQGQAINRSAIILTRLALSILVIALGSFLYKERTLVKLEVVIVRGLVRDLDRESDESRFSGSRSLSCDSAIASVPKIVNGCATRSGRI